MFPYAIQIRFRISRRAVGRRIEIAQSRAGIQHAVLDVIHRPVHHAQLLLGCLLHHAQQLPFQRYPELGVALLACGEGLEERNLGGGLVGEDLRRGFNNSALFRQHRPQQGERFGLSVLLHQARNQSFFPGFRQSFKHEGEVGPVIARVRHRAQCFLEGRGRLTQRGFARLQRIRIHRAVHDFGLPIQGCTQPARGRRVPVMPRLHQSPQNSGRRAILPGTIPGDGCIEFEITLRVARGALGRLLVHGRGPGILPLAEKALRHPRPRSPRGNVRQGVGRGAIRLHAGHTIGHGCQWGAAHRYRTSGLGACRPARPQPSCKDNGRCSTGDIP